MSELFSSVSQEDRTQMAEQLSGQGSFRAQPRLTSLRANQGLRDELQGKWNSAWGGLSCGVDEPGLRAVNKMVTQGFGVG